MTEPLGLEFRSPDGETLEIEWRREALAELDPAAHDADAVWRLAGELDWDEVGALRVISGRLPDSRLLAIAAIRPAGAQGHGEEAIAGALDGPHGIEPLERIMVSTELSPEGRIRRLGLELYGEEEEIPLRLAGNAREATETREGQLTRDRAVCDLRLGESGGGVAIIDVLTRS